MQLERECLWVWLFTKPFGLKEVSEGVSWAVREVIVQIRCDRKDAEWVKNVDEVADRVYQEAHA